MNQTLKEFTVKRLLLSLAVLLILVAGLTNQVDRTASDQLNSAFTSAMTTFVLVRGMNAAISVFQGTEVAIEPGGVGVILTPGQVLDPVNDLIERFSWVVLAAGTSLGAQILLLNFGSSLLAKILLLLAGVILLANLWAPIFDQLKWRYALLRIALLALFLRFLIPVVVIANEAIYNLALEPTFSESYSALESVAQDVEEFQEEQDTSISADSDEGVLSSIRGFVERTSQSMNIAARYREFSERVAAGADSIVRIIAIYVFQTFVFPLLFLWLAVKSGRLVIGASFWTSPNQSNQSNSGQD